MEHKLTLKGNVNSRMIGAQKAPASWKIKNTLRISFLVGWLFYNLAVLFSRITGIPTVVGDLKIRVRRLRDEYREEYLDLVAKLTASGISRDEIEKRLSVYLASRSAWMDYGTVSYRLITDAFVNYVVDDWDSGANDINLFNYHGCGIGTGAEAAGDTALGNECTTVLNPDSTRATGTKSQPTANQARTIGTPLFDGTAAVTEHGVFTQAATGGGTLWDRSLFTAINVGSGDSIQFTYTCTFTSGG